MPILRASTLALFLLFDGLTATVADAQDTDAASGWAAFDQTHVIARGAQGLADRASGRKARASNPVRVASISKLAVAMAVMRLVERGRLDLDRDVSIYLGWHLRHPGFPDQPISLRHLLSHTAGVRDGIEYTLPLDADLEVEMKRPEAWDMAHGPAAGYFTYANLNFPIVAAVLESVTGKRFDAVMASEVFGPLKLDACYNWTTCSMRAVRRAVVLYRADGSIARDDLRGERPVCVATPARDGSCDVATYRLGHQGAFFGPQGGMRISPPGLARLGQVLMGAVPGFLSPASLAEMTRPQWRYDGSNGDTLKGYHCAYGLAVMFTAFPGAPAGCRDDPFGDGVMRIGHSGEAYGLRSGLWLDPKTGKGVSFYVTAMPDDAPTGRSAFTAAEEAMMARAGATR
ncbi:serine hydrolase domain-containing protein [Sphingobium nicotianae]|uniref:Beta-lactamase family protein n=1 Tax=Sphingobium nicotianae TaxID=2782607 RepID=A0A9X1DDI0_9SPHN|nr:serine hydrolase domain-containing protein [Sphingobium nicotianae]MBT2187895.1 beta-lactamase family protein [Sphingobium nicotianae]